MSDVEKWIEQWQAGLTGLESLSSSDVGELESHLREEMEHLKAAGLSDEEAFLFSRRRLGDATTLETEFRKVSPHRRLAGRLSWMVGGALGLLLTMRLTIFITQVSTVAGFAAGLRSTPLAFLTCVVQVMAFVGIGVMVWRYAGSRPSSQAEGERVSPSVRVATVVACVIVAIWWAGQLSQYLLTRVVGPRDMGEIAMAQAWVSLGWSMLMPFLLVGLLAVLAMRNHRRVETQ